jgi:phosphoribosylformylglycinamidine synthase I
VRPVRGPSGQPAGLARGGVAAPHAIHRDRSGTPYACIVPARIGVVTFPGSLDDRDAVRAIQLAGGEGVPLWHADPSLHGVDAVVLPGGFSYGDYLRCGAIARFAPVMQSVIEQARAGLPVLGICNGFQILCESHLLPGALIRNDARRFVCRDQRLRVENVRTRWTGSYRDGAEIVVPIKNGEGGYVADHRTLDELEAAGRIVARYAGDNPNGSYRDIAGICDETGAVVGLMPHPEHAVDPLTGPTADGLGFFTSILRELVGAK